MCTSHESGETTHQLPSTETAVVWNPASDRKVLNAQMWTNPTGNMNISADSPPGAKEMMSELEYNGQTNTIDQHK
jgi:hypothetical protein